MFWLFRRKKVADKKTITPCVCENGAEGDDAYTLHEFSGFTNYNGSKNITTTTEGSALSKLSIGDNRGPRKGYRRLQGETTAPEEQPTTVNETQPGTATQPAVAAAASGTAKQVQPICHQSTSMPSSSSSSSQLRQQILLEYDSGSSSTEYSDECGLFTSDDDEDLTCNVCDRAFYSIRLLLEHQQKKRHYGCSICDSIFPNLMALELHKETLDHWSSDELTYRDTDSDDDEPEEYYDNVYDNVRTSRELERLL